MLGNIGLRGIAAWQAGNGEAMHVELSDLVGTADEAHELLLRQLERRIRHQVEQTYMQGTDVLTLRVFQAKHGEPLIAQVAKRGEPGMLNDRHDR